MKLKLCMTLITLLIKLHKIGPLQNLLRYVPLCRVLFGHSPLHWWYIVRSRYSPMPRFSRSCSYRWCIVAESFKAMYIQFYQHMQSAEYRQELELKIAVETVRIVILLLLQALVMYQFGITRYCVRLCLLYCFL